MYLKVLKEENYEEVMKTTVEPYLNAHRETGYFERVKGEPIYYEHYREGSPKGVIVISHGFTESIKKFSEVIYYMLQAGYEVWGVDHRGHGRSIRLNDNPHVVHAEVFEDYVLDLVYFTDNIVKPATGELPIYLYCHSMGGCIGAWILSKYPNLFDKAVLSSPMLGLTFGKIPVPVVYALASIMGIGERRKNPFGSDGTFNTEPDFENSASSSRTRYDYYFKKSLEDPYLQTCAPSIQWGKEAAKACKYVVSHADRVKIPVMLFQAGADTIVKNSAENTFAERAKNCELINIPDVKHELYMTDSEVLEPYINKVIEFLG